jgi:hypothetical protein
MKSTQENIMKPSIIVAGLALSLVFPAIAADLQETQK